MNFDWTKRKNLQILIDDGRKDKKPKGTKKYVIKRKIISQNYKNCLEATQLENKINYPEKIKTNFNSLKRVINNS